MAGSVYTPSRLPPRFSGKGGRSGCRQVTVYLVDRQLFFIVCFAFAHKSAFTLPQYVETLQWKRLFVNKGSLSPLPPSTSQFFTKSWLLQQLRLHQKGQKVQLCWAMAEKIRPWSCVWAAGDCFPSVFGFVLFLLSQKVEHTLKTNQIESFRDPNPLSQVNSFFPLSCSVVLCGPLCPNKNKSDGVS